MAAFNQPRNCNKSCGAMIYFDRNSLVGHPKENVWLPLEYRNGLKTDTLHDCPQKTNGTINTYNVILLEPTNLFTYIKQRIKHLDFSNQSYLIR